MQARWLPLLVRSEMYHHLFKHKGPQALAPGKITHVINTSSKLGSDPEQTEQTEQTERALQGGEAHTLDTQRANRFKKLQNIVQGLASCVMSPDRRSAPKG